MVSPHAKSIANLFPRGVELVVADDETKHDLFPEEAVAISTAVDERKRDFALGRACARLALSRLGVPAVAIPSLSNRAPLWPPGVVGSITHCPGFAAAAVARMSEFGGLGLDAESNQRPLAPGLARRICTSREQNIVLDRGVESDERLRLIFSAKESVYKAVAPISGVYLGFQDVAIEFDFATDRFSAHLVREVAKPLPDFDKLEGRFIIMNDVIVTSVILPAIAP